MDEDGVAVGGSGGRRELDDGETGKVTYVGDWTKCIVLKEGVRLEEVRRMVSEITSNVLTVHQLWYSLKYDRGMVMELEGDDDLRMFSKGNDEHVYLYVGDNDGPKRHAQKATWRYDHGVVCGRSDRDRDDMVQEGRKRAALEGHLAHSPMSGEMLTAQRLDIALLEIHRAASKCGNIHEDHDKYTAVMPTATLL
ncbi:hypothetical protein Cgig2_023624 [Carnegiea gigantea]|uniref:Uncharacterized protein n=1 Tax=Carnegiea gigantea TaxID=171969 RepID=A0A9Q1KEL6_9CARY|nr:hypothetical protein Cgig2_023624 [Carnegiea gigantea]